MTDPGAEPAGRRSFLARLTLALDALPLAGAHRGLGSMIEACDPTSSTDEGPYYRPGAPFRATIADGVEGERLVVTGRVVAGPDCTPVPGAILDVWQADSAGRYDVDLGAEARAAWRLRGRIRTAADGTYRLETIRPAAYAVGGGMRPAHIHVLVRAPGRPDLVTELFFADDPHLAADPAGHVRPDLVHPLVRRGVALHLEHDFVLGA